MCEYGVFWCGGTLIMWKGGEGYGLFRALFLESLGKVQRGLSHMSASAVAQTVI